MKRTVNIQEAKTHLSRLLAEVHQGDEITIAKNGKPYARLVPLESEPKAKVPLGFLKLDLPDSFFDPLPDEELDAWEGGPN